MVKAGRARERELIKKKGLIEKKKKEYKQLKYWRRKARQLDYRITNIIHPPI